MKEITITEAHIRLLERTYVGWDDDAYDGAPAVNIKRPYGNSYVPGDLLEITDPARYEAMSEDEHEDWYNEDHDDLMAIHREMEYVVQITLNLAGKGELIEAGQTYHRPEQYNSRTWARKDDA